MNIDKSVAFRNEVTALGLSARRPSELGGLKQFYLDLNQDPLSVPADPKVVLKLVQLARKYADDEHYGEHNSILQLTTNRNELNRNTVLWSRPYHVKGGEGWITLSNWLKIAGQSYEPEGTIEAGTHLEKKDSEIFLGNFTQEQYEDVRWKTKRRGLTAFNLFGEVIEPQETFPVFVSRRELEDAGFVIR